VSISAGQVVVGSALSIVGWALQVEMAIFMGALFKKALKPRNRLTLWVRV